MIRTTQLKDKSNFLLNIFQVALYNPLMLYFELLCGASGDMILASLVDLGVTPSYLEDRFRPLRIPGLKIQRSRQIRAGQPCSQLQISWSEDSQREYRNLASILSLLEHGNYAAGIVGTCRRILSRLAEAESRVHGVPVDQVHFHEIGAVDTVVDVLGFALAVDYLRASRIRFSTLTVGSGTIDTAHGTLPVPAPATRDMLTGFRVRTLATGTEILTPTGCAILTACGRQVSRKPKGRLLGQGFGCGQKRIAGFSDYLRVLHLSENSPGEIQSASSTSSS
ncbi:MAG: LarC family nickel insertion protein [Spirochaetaceae bacterium]|nr:MAG: LarC family nickel insertion protein [Spirochaetaceae bacterium]